MWGKWGSLLCGLGLPMRGKRLLQWELSPPTIARLLGNIRRWEPSGFLRATHAHLIKEQLLAQKSTLYKTYTCGSANFKTEKFRKMSILPGLMPYTHCQSLERKYTKFTSSAKHERNSWTCWRNPNKQLCLLVRVIKRNNHTEGSGSLWHHTPWQDSAAELKWQAQTHYPGTDRDMWLERKVHVCPEWSGL